MVGDGDKMGWWCLSVFICVYVRVCPNARVHVGVGITFPRVPPASPPTTVAVTTAAVTGGARIAEAHAGATRAISVTVSVTFAVAFAVTFAAAAVAVIFVTRVGVPAWHARV